MEPVQLFQLAARRNEWLAIRQSVVAGNIANANTPGWKARDVESFATILDGVGTRISRTSAQHLGASSSSLVSAQARETRTWSTVHSGNTVSIEQELLKAGEVRAAYSLNASIVKAFHRMILASARG